MHHSIRTHDPTISGERMEKGALIGGDLSTIKNRLLEKLEISEGREATCKFADNFPQEVKAHLLTIIQNYNDARARR